MIVSPYPVLEGKVVVTIVVEFARTLPQEYLLVR